MGAWHAYSLPPDDNTGYCGAFCGPLLMKNNGIWLGRKASQLILTGNNGEKILWNNESTVSHYLPGILWQSLKSADMKVERSLVFADDRTALIASTVTNTGNRGKSFFWQLQSELLSDDLEVVKNENMILFRMIDSSLFCITLHDENFCLHTDDNRFTIVPAAMITLEPGERITLPVAESYFFDTCELENHRIQIERYLLDPQAVLDANSGRWNVYLSKILKRISKSYDSPAYRVLAVKCVETLISNWRSPAGSLRHNGLFPSVAYQGFYGFWAWDSWKHAAALALFNDSLAKESVRSMFDYQNERGMVADCIYHDPAENNWRNTKPPLAAWAVWNIFQETGDTAFVRETWPALEKYHGWWYIFRDNDQDGLCEYGSTDGTLIAAKWESGMDNAVRFDRSRIIENESGEWSLDQESVDLNTFLQQEKQYMSQLAFILSLNGETHEKQKKAEELQNDALLLATKIPDHFWSEEFRYFMDRPMTRGGFIGHFGPEGWLPLWAGLADKRQAREVAAVIMDEERFNTIVPLPTLDATDPAFDPSEGYWRGPVWIDQVYFAIRGLKRYGYKREAVILTNKLVENSEGLLTDGPVRENYHPLTGNGLNAEHFSWSAAHLLLLLSE